MLERREVRQNAAALSLFLLVFQSGGIAKTQEPKWDSIPPVATMKIEPLPEDARWVADTGPTEPFGVPEALPVDEETWRAMKEAARSDPRAPAPDQVLEEPSKMSLPANRFTGAGWDQIWPPDVSLAKSPNRIVEVANSQIQLFNTAGVPLAGKILREFFVANEPDSTPPFDPKVIYDRSGANPRFYVIAAQHRAPDAGPVFARIHVAVSRSPNPSNLDLSSWCVYALSALDDFDSVDELVHSDQPNLGVAADTLMITSDQVTFGVTPVFTYALIFAFEKNALSNNAASCPGGIATVFRPSSTRGDPTTISLQPVNHYSYPSSFTGTTNPAYAVSATVGSDSFYSVYRVRNLLQDASSNRLQRTTFNGQTVYGIPPDARQLAPQSNAVIETFDARVWQAVGISNSVWLSQHTVCQSGGGPTESCFRTVKFDLSQNSSGAPVATLREHKTVGGGANVFYMFPSIAVNGAGRIVVPFMRSTATTYPSSLWAGKNATQASFATPQSLAIGECPREGTVSCSGGICLARAGDYLGAQVDPVDFSTFWIAGERPAFFPPGLGLCSWTTEILQVQ